MKSKYFIWYTLKKKWYQRKQKECIMLSFDNDFLRDKLSFEFLEIVKNNIINETGKNISKINSIEFLGSFTKLSSMVLGSFISKTTTPIDEKEKNNKFNLKNFL